MAAALKTTQTVDPGKIAKVYDIPLSDSAKWLFCCVTMNSCCWNKIKDRAYVQVHENRIEMNYPCVPCFLCCCEPCDQVSVIYYDRINSGFDHPCGCTPFHFCMCVPCCGDVVSIAPSDCCNKWWCVCCPKTYFPGLSNGRTFAELATRARQAFRDGNRLTVFDASSSGVVAVAAPAVQTMPVGGATPSGMP